jgi:preprotein translocase subunit SecY
MPYISASIFQQIAQAVVPQIDKMSKDEEGRKRLNQWSRYATVLLAAVQAWGFSIFAEGITGAVGNPGFSFRILMTFFLTVGAIFVMWLGEQITERGIGNGASLMIFFSIVERIWPSIFTAFGYVSTGRYRRVLASRPHRGDGRGGRGVVAVTMAARRVLIQIPQRTMARGRMREASRSFIPLRINSSGVMPIVFAQSVIVVPGAIAQFWATRVFATSPSTSSPGATLYYVLRRSSSCSSRTSTRRSSSTRSTWRRT